MKILVTGTQGQLAASLRLRADGEEVICIGRPQLDLERPETIAPAIDAVKPDVVVNAAAYTAVDQAEQEPQRAMAVNGAGAGAVAAAAAALGAPVIQISTDYVFDGKSQRPYEEDEPTAPLGAYGASKLQGEALARAANPRCVVLRTAWVYSPFGKNFLHTMLRLAQTRDEIGVVADQIGSPTSALSLAETALAVARNLRRRPDDADLYGVFNAVDGGEASWADLASAIFEKSAAGGGPAARVRRIATSEYPTPATRPANSRLSTKKLERIHGAAPPQWRDALGICVDMLLLQEFAKAVQK
ncbi:MAG TPA: dTDP-4-dehydrorhamnose reductase [Methylocystis sp.]|nr:dTDP-4-dehydrorhamnose reductase [Methylocystis sp.]